MGLVMDFDCYTGYRSSIPTQFTVIFLASEQTFAQVNSCFVRKKSVQGAGRKFIY